MYLEFLSRHLSAGDSRLIGAKLQLCNAVPDLTFLEESRAAIVGSRQLQAQICVRELCDRANNS